MKDFAQGIAGYTFGAGDVPRSPVSLQDLEQLKVSVGFTAEDSRYLKLAGEVLADQAKAIVEHWRSGIIASIPHLARHSRDLDGHALPDYLAKSNRRFEQWILDTCLRPYDQDWLNYQQEIGLRHTPAKKNKTDNADSLDLIPLRYLLAFTAVVIATSRDYLAAGGRSPDQVGRMHSAFTKSVMLHVTVWTRAYVDATMW